MKTTISRYPTATMRILHGALVRAGSVSIAVAAMTTTLLTTPDRAVAADDTRLQRMATCEDSWLDWKNDAVRLARYVDDVDARYTRADGGPAFTPKSSTTAFGLPVEQVFPQSVGMAVGFSLMVRADLATTKRAFEKQIGAMSCTTGSDGTGCELKLGSKKMAVLMTDDPQHEQTLLGCFYHYER